MPPRPTLLVAVAATLVAAPVLGLTPPNPDLTAFPSHAHWWSDTPATSPGDSLFPDPASDLDSEGARSSSLALAGDFSFRREVGDLLQPDEAPAAKPPIAYGLEGQDWLTFTAGAAWDFDETYVINALNVSWSRFLDDDFEWLIEAGLWGFSQPGEDAFSGSASTIFRWHAINHNSWSLFLDAGIGFGLHSDPVPEDGTRYDFMPRIGAGFSWQIGDTPNRFIAGVRWQHWSNAHLEGDEDNPPLDTAEIYFGLSFPLP